MIMENSLLYNGTLLVEPYIKNNINQLVERDSTEVQEKYI